MPSFLIILVIVAVVGAAASILRFRAVAAAWTVAATELGAEMASRGPLSPPRLDGIVESMEVTVDIYRTGGRNSQTFTRYAVRYPPLRLGLQMRRQTGLTTFAKFFGFQDHEVGDETFDDAFAIKTTDPTRLGMFFTPARREALVRLLAAYQSLEVDDDELRYLRRGVERDPVVIVSTVRRLAASAAAFTGARPAGGFDEVIAARRLGNTADAAERLTGVVHDRPDDVESKIVEVETLYTAGRSSDAREVLRDLESTAPADPEVEGWRDVVRRKTPGLQTDGIVDTDPVAVAEALFGDSRLSFETTSLFEDEYAGRRVRWSGTVRRSSLRTSDHDFDATVTKALVHVATIENDLYGNAEVDAVVAFPPNAADRISKGDQVTFTGRLVRVDGLVRNLFVADGELV